MSLRITLLTTSLLVCLFASFCVHAQVNKTMRDEFMAMHNVVRQAVKYGLIPGQPRAVHMRLLVCRVFTQFDYLISLCLFIYTICVKCAHQFF